MGSKSRLLGRNLQIDSGAKIYFGLLATIIVTAFFCAIPIVYLNLLLPYIESNFELNISIINLTVSTTVLIVLLFTVKSFDLGFKRFFLKKADNYDSYISDIFHYFLPKNILNVGLYTLKLFLFKGFFLLICLFPFVITIVFCGNLTNKVSLLSGALALATAALFFINGIIYYKKITISLFAADYYFVSGKYINFTHLISSSQTALKNKKRELQKVRFSFIGWFLLCVFIFPAFFIFSYYQQTMAVLAAEYIKE